MCFCLLGFSVFCFVVCICSDMGCHIDWFHCCSRSHSCPPGQTCGKAADIAAVNTVIEVSLRLVRPGRKVILLFKMQFWNVMTPFCFFEVGVNSWQFCM